jgi:hypothetical protein
MIPLYVTGTGDTKYLNKFDTTEDISQYYTNQSDSGGLLGLFGEPFDNVFKDYTHTTEKYYFPLLVSFDSIIEIAPKFHIPATVLTDIKVGKCKILIACPYEGFPWNFWEMLIDIVVAKYKLAFQHFVVMDGNLESHPEIKSVYFNFWERNMIYADLPNFCNTGTGKIMMATPRRDKFIFMNRRPHSGRIAAVTLMHEHLDSGAMSLHLNGQMHPDYYEHQEILFEANYSRLFKKYKEIDLRSKLPLTLDDGIDAEQENPVFDMNVDKFYNSFLHIVAETCQTRAGGERMFFSEKIFKPMMTMQPFILLGQQHSLRALKQLGYRTFGTFLDESYDNIENDELRVEAAIHSAIIFFDQPFDVLHEIMIEMMGILIHNISHLQYRCMTYDNNTRIGLSDALHN